MRNFKKAISFKQNIFSIDGIDSRNPANLEQKTK